MWHADGNTECQTVVINSPPGAEINGEISIIMKYILHGFVRVI
jgi:hypothetical protein